MADNSSRPLTDHERRLIDKLLTAEFAGRESVAAQIDQSLVTVVDENGSLRFATRSDGRADVERRIPVEGQFPDSDGTIIHVLLHVVDGKVRELEIYKDDSSPVIELPPAGRLELI